jgi:hypothetical protein
VAYHWYTSTGAFVVGLIVLTAIGRAFKVGWQKSRHERRHREELLARFAGDMSRLAEKKNS